MKTKRLMINDDMEAVQDGLFIRLDLSDGIEHFSTLLKPSELEKLLEFVRVEMKWNL